MTTKDLTAPPGGIMTDEVGTITGDVTLRPEVSPAGDVSLQVQYKGADEWYRVTGAHLKVDPANADAVSHAEEELLNRY